MNTAQLECFVSLASTLNFVKTAAQLGLTQPAVTKQIQSIEKELGVTLFQRTSRSVELTLVGEQFLPEAIDMLNIYYRSKNWIRSYTGRDRNPLRIGYSDPLMMQVLSAMLKTCLSLWPEPIITPELVCDQTDANLSRLEKAQLDCVLSMRDSSFEHSEIIFSVLRNCGFICGISRSHPLAAVFLENPELPREITTEKIWPYRQIIAIPPYLLKKYFSRGHRLIPVNDELNNVICSNINEASALIVAGFGYCLIPEYLNLGHPEILYLKWTESKKAPFGIYYRKPENRNDPLNRFVKICKEYYAEKPSV